MTESEAVYKSDEFIKLMLQHQPNLFVSCPLNDPENAKTAAQSLAALRQELIELLTKQK